MANSPVPDGTKRPRFISFGETVALAALIVSALGLWNSWRTEEPETPVTSAETKAIPIAFRGNVEAGGKEMIISPVEAGHALESLTLSVSGLPSISTGSDGRLVASEVQRLVKDGAKGQPGSVRVNIQARYIEAGQVKRGGGPYRISYRWDDGGLFGGEKLRLTGLSLG